MKNRWAVEYWDHDREVAVKRWFETYEAAITHQHKIMKKFNSINVKIKLRG